MISIFQYNFLFVMPTVPIDIKHSSLITTRYLLVIHSAVDDYYSTVIGKGPWLPNITPSVKCHCAPLCIECIEVNEKIQNWF